MTGHRRELDNMNALACLLVILIHVLSLGISTADRASVQAAVIYFPWRLAAFVVPMFLYTGAVKLARQFAEGPVTPRVYRDYVLRRIRKIYLPYVCAVAVYYLCFLPIGYVRGSVREFLTYLAVGNLSSPFYYIVIVMQFYLLMPLWVWTVRHVPFQLGMGLSLLVTFCMQQFGPLLSLFSVEFRYSDRVFATYLFFWAWGLYVGRYYDRIEALLPRRRWQKALCAAVIVLCAGLAYLQYRGVPVPFAMNDVKLVADALSILLVHALCTDLLRAPERVQGFFARVARSSFPVYLSHCLFLTLATAFAQGHGVQKLSVLLPLRALVCYTVPFFLDAAYRRVRAALAEQKSAGT